MPPPDLLSSEHGGGGEPRFNRSAEQATGYREHEVLGLLYRAPASHWTS
ncbi:MAG: hypothetical protein OXJ90_22815 [Spirochaetaceae bacterium]|nr:hypothetical protein [Spirochaetaceae bacterium]